MNRSRKAAPLAVLASAIGIGAATVASEVESPASWVAMVVALAALFGAGAALGASMKGAK
ncbi:MAG: hypothetical protein CSA58_11510 [Micrococcales bacterium]|nr:MAG: hypothetical protein CSB46_02370 [Micrococcales bacterium]PIE26080.1 MAG: hypothetical protein CSA58_11510 [Micrococcales bacterium]